MVSELKTGWSLAIHGGAGEIAPDLISSEQESVYRGALSNALDAGTRGLINGGTALDAVEAAVVVMEANPLFNAGRGAVFNAEGRNELDASIMDGKALRAGAVAGVTRTRSPISLARSIMDRSPHVMMVGEGAERFARSQMLEEVNPNFFFSERRWQSLLAFLTKEGLPVPPKQAGQAKEVLDLLVHDEGKLGTVGAVALDSHGDLAAATSTGGITGKRWGRVGDTPIIGAGCYAANDSCAVSCTGDGEYFIRLGVARAIAARMEMRLTGIQEAVDALVQHSLRDLGGKGGVIAVTSSGTIAWSFNTKGMYRARASSAGPTIVSLFHNDP